MTTNKGPAKNNGQADGQARRKPAQPEDAHWHICDDFLDKAANFFGVLARVVARGRYLPEEPIFEEDSLEAVVSGVVWTSEVPDSIPLMLQLRRFRFWFAIEFLRIYVGAEYGNGMEKQVWGVAENWYELWEKGKGYLLQELHKSEERLRNASVILRSRIEERGPWQSEVKAIPQTNDDDAEWSRWEAPNLIAKELNITLPTLKSRIRAGFIEKDDMSTKQWRIRMKGLPEALRPSARK
jgi:hypothetical protein